MEKRWRLKPHDRQMVEQVERAAGVAPIVAQLLASRGIFDPTLIRSFLDAKLTDLRDPNLLPGVTDASRRIHQAIQNKQKICIYGDYDADGMTATAILYGCLTLIGGDVIYHVPNRLDDGYGLNCDALRQIKQRGAELVISVDCGIASIKPAETAKEIGLPLIVTDHHEFGEELPDAEVLVHPRLPGSDYPFGGLCGAGVAFKLAWAICQVESDSTKVRPALREFLLRALGLAAIGTIADVVPLVDENRILVKQGLPCVAQRSNIGLQKLLSITKLSDKPQLSAEDIAFMLGPRLNAAGRLGQALLGVELLVTESNDRATWLAEYINELNSSRESLDRSIYRAANKLAKEEFDPVNDPALVLAGRGWHAGVIGIVAGRIAEKYNRPTVIIALDQVGNNPGLGSARTACGIDLHRALEHCTDLLLSHGGHAAAAGLRVDEANIDSFRDEFLEHVAAEVTDSDKVAELDIDIEAPLSLLTLEALNQLETLAPFGQAHPRPLFAATGVQLSGPPKRMGSGDRHLSLTLEQHGVRLRAVAFGKGDWAEHLEQIDGDIDIAYRPVINEFRGRRSVELHLVDWRVHETAVAPEAGL